MNAGEYVGKDQRTYRWGFDTHGIGSSVSGYKLKCVSEDDGWYYSHIQPPDWPAAKAALDELIEAEAEEWVEWSWHSFEFRCHPDGSEVQERQGSQMWQEYLDDHSSIGATYRKGLEIGEAKGREVALEQVQKLVEAVLIDDFAFDGTAAGCTVTMRADQWQRIRELAKAVKT